MRHIISIVVKNNSGVLARVSSLFGRRGFNIDSLSVSTTDDPKVSRITVVVNGDDSTLEQVVKQTTKLEEAVNVQVLSEDNSVCRELLLIKVVCKEGVDGALVDMADSFGAQILDITDKSLIFELTGTSAKIDSFIAAIQHDITDKPCVVSKVCRTGITAMKRGKGSSYEG